METTPLDSTLLDRYLTGEATSDERATVETWLADSPEARGVVDALQQLDRSVDPATDQQAERTALEALRTVIRHQALSPETMWIGTDEARLAEWQGREEQKLGTRSRWRNVWYGAVSMGAAALLIMSVLGIAHRFGHRVPPAMAMYTTANGQRATITLTDGNIVVLNVASQLAVPADYASGNHTVRLVGEGLFTVSHHEGTPFTVLAGPTVTRVLGTNFVVRRYGTDTTTTVAVSRGKVAVGAAIVTQDRLLEVGQSGVARLSHADAAQFGFATGVLALRSMTLSQAIPELDRWYNATIQLGDSALATKRVKGDVTAGSLGDLVELLSETLNVRVVRNGRTLTLYSK